MKHIRTIMIVAVAAISGVGLAACGGSSSTSSSSASPSSGSSQSASGTSTSGNSSKVTTLKVGIVAASSLATDYLGIQQGYFAQQGLKLNFIPGETAAALVAQVLSGQVNITFAPTASVIAADANGAKLQMIGPQGGLIAPNQPSSAIVVLPGSPIKTVKELVGKTVGVIALKSELDVLMHTEVKNAGGDEKAVQSVQIPFPTMYTALKAHRVDAIVTTEPFLTIAKEQGVRTISNLETDLLPNGSTGAWVATQSYIKANPAIIKAFQKANAQSIVYTKAHVAAARALLPKITSMAPALAKIVNLGLIYDPNLNVASIEKLGGMMKDLGYVPNVPPVSQLIAPGS